MLWWFYITWKQYRDHTDEKAFPVWHALTLIVPIYSLFRVHAHVRTFKELMTKRQVAESLSPRAAVVASIVMGILGYIGISDVLFGEISKTLALWLFVAAGIITAITAWLVVAIQGNINRYWSAVSPRAASCRIGIGEVLITILGMLLWVDTIAVALSDSWRTI